MIPLINHDSSYNLPRYIMEKKIQMFQTTNQFTYELQDQQIMSPALWRTSAPVVGWVTHETQEFQDTLDIQSGLGWVTRPGHPERMVQ